jgi:hypothetical protein
MPIADSAIWRAKFVPTRLPRYPHILCDPPARRPPRCLHHLTATHRPAAIHTHSLRSPSRLHHPHHVRAAWCANPPSENVRWLLCGANNASASAQRVPLRRRAQYTAVAIQTCLIDSRLRTPIGGVTARGANGAGRRTTLVTASAHGRGGIESLAWELGSCRLFSDVLYPLVVVCDEAIAWKALLFTVICILELSVLLLASVYRVNCIGIVRDRSIARPQRVVLTELDHFQRSSHVRPRPAVP